MEIKNIRGSRFMDLIRKMQGYFQKDKKLVELEKLFDHDKHILDEIDIADKNQFLFYFTSKFNVYIKDDNMFISDYIEAYEKIRKQYLELKYHFKIPRTDIKLYLSFDRDDICCICIVLNLENIGEVKIYHVFNLDTFIISESKYKKIKNIRVPVIESGLMAL